MIKKLVLSHFQCHKKKSIEFDPGVNIIGGPSDTGKSSIIRALKWVIFNKPAGDSFRRHGSKRTVAKLFTDEHTIIRTKTNSINTYELDGATLKSFGTAPPPEVEEAIQLSPINFQEQHDSPFMLSETAGECGRMLNKMVDLEVIDRALKNLNRLLSKTKNDENYNKEHLNELKERLSKYDFLGDMRDALNDLQEKKADIDRIKMNMNSLSLITEELSVVEEKLAAIPDCASILKQIEVIERTGEKYELMRQECERFHTTYEAAQNITEDLNNLPDYSDILKRIKEIQEASKALTEAQEQLDELHHTMFAIKKNDTEIKNCKDSVEVDQKTYDKLMGKECPLCHQKLQ